ncbi:MAG: aminotransferase class III-fold pyridoxal phosphate-dependent enzyme [candidate division Zixibacteria bacterium]|nr:aminotransferase class III-fold pyridoxal phosphate-dependent enzyme [candidate division Zixibacteria bacterium]
MTAPALQTTSLEEAYHRTFLRSYALYQRALKRFPNGVTHDGRFMLPFPVYVNRADGSHKWTEDGHQLIDYWMGHGALLLGHGRAEIVAAVTEQAARGTHYGACHELEIEWADWITKLVPCAETVRFVSSGTEATLMAIRLARTFTGRRKVVKFYGHYHGWHDNVMDGTGINHDHPLPGVLPEVFDSLISLPSHDLNRVEDTLKNDSDIAVLMLEPTGALFGGVEIPDGFVTGLRELTSKYGVLFLMDEVVTGFRCAPGGAQEHFGVKPDLTTLAKIVAGGLPGGAVAGRADIMSLLEIRLDPVWQANRKMVHYGTFNACPLSAAAGIAALKIVATGRDIALANERADTLRRRFAEVLAGRGLENWHVFGTFSGVKLSYSNDPRVSRRSNLALIHALRQGMLLHGVDMVGVDGLTSSAHTPQDIEHTAQAFDDTLAWLQKEGKI